MKKNLPYKRILLKLSGEILLGNQKFGIDHDAVTKIAYSLADMHKAGFEVAIVIGGGNIFRGIQLKKLGMQRTPADHLGMLATLMNGIALQQGLAHVGCESSVMSALECPQVAETYHWETALKHFNERKTVIFVGGTGNPYFTTDTAAALRACEIHADILIKATKVDGIYDKDPIKYPDAKKFTTLSFTDMLQQRLEIMDSTAVALCMNNRIPIFVFDMKQLGEKSMVDILSNPALGTLVQA